MAETLPVIIYPEEPVQHSDPNEIPVFYEYQWSDVALAKKGGGLNGKVALGWAPYPTPI